jgi:hypothetical protein
MKFSTKEEALELVTTRLSKNTTDTKWYHVFKERTIEKPFGWVFFYEVIISCGGSVSSGSAQKIRTVIVNKHSHQVIGNSIDQPIETTIKLYETLLAESKAVAEGWCLTFNPRGRKNSALMQLAEKATKAGFFEISKQ